MKALLLEIPLFLLAAYFWVDVKWLKMRGRRAPFNELMLRTPGHSARELHRDTVVNLLLYMVGVAATPFFVAALFSQSTAANWILAASGTLLIGFCFFQSVRLFRMAIRRNLGVEAELFTGSELSLLMRDGAWVFHDIPYQYGNIDHVVIGTGGIFAIETKGFNKPTKTGLSGAENATLTVKDGALQFPTGGRTKAPLEQAKLHAKWIREEIQRRFGLSVPVRAVVALPGWMINGGFDDDCWVVNPKRGNSLRSAVTKQIVEPQTATMIAAWVEDLARSVAHKSKEFDADSGTGF